MIIPKPMAVARECGALIGQAAIMHATLESGIQISPFVLK